MRSAASQPSFQILQMRLQAPFLLTSLLVLAVLQCVQADLVKRTLASTTEGISANDVKAGYEHILARYAALAEKKKQEASNPSHLYGQLKLETPEGIIEAAPSAPRRRGTVIPLHAVGGYPKMLGQTYNAEVGVGTPAQFFNLTADTGSMLTWAVQASCSEADCPGVKTKKTYDVTKSTTDKKLRKDHEAYGDGEMDVMLFTDVVTLGKLKVNAATVGGATKTFEKDGQLEHDGLLGLGTKLQADPEPVLDSLATQNKAFNQIVAFDLGPQASMEIGGYDSGKYPKLSNFKVESDEGWTLAGSSITAQGAAKTEPVELLLDTGSSVAMFPASRMDAIMNRPGLKVQKTTTNPITYSMPCDTKLNLQLILPDGTIVPIRDEDILMKSNDANMPGCLSLLVGTTIPFLPVVAGTPILQSMYTVLRKTTNGDWIGLAPLQIGSAK